MVAPERDAVPGLDAAVLAVHREACGVPGCDEPYPLDARQARAALDAAAPAIRADERGRIRQLAEHHDAQISCPEGCRIPGREHRRFADLLEDPPAQGGTT